MPAYMIARATITDQHKYENEFMPVMTVVFKAHSAKFLVRTDNVITIKGNDQIARAAVVEFPDHAAAMACATSPDFLAAMNLAETCMTDHAVRLIDGLQEPKSGAEPVAKKAKEPAE